MFETAIEWLKEYGDVLGGIGSITALTMLLITNGRVIMHRLTGKTFIRESDNSLGKPDYGGKTAIAVMPYKTLGDVDHHFGDGLISDLIADIKGAGFAVAAPETQTGTSSTEIEASKVTKKLGTKYALTTNLRQQEDTRRVSAQLIDTNGAIVWSQRFDASGANLIEVQEGVAAKIATAISEEILAENIPTVAVLPSVELSLQTQAGADVGFIEDNEVSPKSRFIAFMLCFFVVGLFGAHRFYVGRPFTGMLYILTAGLFTFGWFFDLILISLGMFADGKGRTLKLFHPQRTIKQSVHVN
ncbi:NINE protein [Kordiimonas aquimaris]|uniref:NINE protein n=1 Tax=Kordiimonas aquimaris TaxID=707591 RepID=UPI0021CEEEDB|nr:NINE protein [Kordiimonas aquimaris]